LLEPARLKRALANAVQKDPTVLADLKSHFAARFDADMVANRFWDRDLTFARHGYRHTGSIELAPRAYIIGRRDDATSFIADALKPAPEVIQ
jgi:hypothetical protein